MNQQELEITAIQVLKSKRVFEDWYTTPIPALNGETPKELCASNEGRLTVLKILRKIESGEFT